MTKARSQSPPWTQYWGMCLTRVSLPFLTGWPSRIPALGTSSKDPDWCVFSTTRLLEANKQFSEGLSPRSSTQVRQAALLMLRLCCCWALALLGLAAVEWAKDFFPFSWLKRGFVTSAWHICKVETLRCVYSTVNVFHQKCTFRGSRLLIQLS